MVVTTLHGSFLVAGKKPLRFYLFLAFHETGLVCNAHKITYLY